MNAEEADDSDSASSTSSSADSMSRKASTLKSAVRRTSRGLLIAIAITLVLVAGWVYTFDDDLRDEALYLFSLIGVIAGAAIDVLLTRRKRKSDEKHAVAGRAGGPAER